MDITNMWVSEITANSSRLESFVQQNSGVDIKIWSELPDDSFPPRYFWSSPHLDALKDRNQVQDRAAGLHALWQGILYVYLGVEYSPLELGILRSDEHDMADLHLGNCYSFPFDRSLVNIPLKQIAGEISPFNSVVDTLLLLARHDQDSRYRLQALGKEGVTLVSLFRLYEDMAKIAKWDDNKIDSEGGSESPVAARFRGTVNNPLQSGAASRHGGPGSKPMSAAPVTIQESAPVLLQAYRKYLFGRAGAIKLKRLVSQSP